MSSDEYLIITDRQSDSPFIERVWRSQSERAGSMMSVASSHCEMVVTRHQGRTQLTLRGPETHATIADYPVGAMVRYSPLGGQLHAAISGGPPDRSERCEPARCVESVVLARRFPMGIPDLGAGRTFVARLVRQGLLVRDPAVAAALRGDVQASSLRSAQRHFLHATRG